MSFQSGRWSFATIVYHSLPLLVCCTKRDKCSCLPECECVVVIDTDRLIFSAGSNRCLLGKEAQGEESKWDKSCDFVAPAKMNASEVVRVPLCAKWSSESEKWSSLKKVIKGAYCCCQQLNTKTTLLQISITPWFTSVHWCSAQSNWKQVVQSSAISLVFPSRINWTVLKMMLMHKCYLVVQIRPRQLKWSK